MLKTKFVDRLNPWLLYYRVQCPVLTGKLRQEMIKVDFLTGQSDKSIPFDWLKFHLVEIELVVHCQCERCIYVAHAYQLCVQKWKGIL